MTKILPALLIVLIGVILVFIEIKAFKAIENRMKKNEETTYNPHYSGYIILGTVSVTVLLVLWVINYFD